MHYGRDPTWHRGLNNRTKGKPPDYEGRKTTRTQAEAEKMRMFVEFITHTLAQFNSLLVPAVWISSMQFDVHKRFDARP